MIHFAALTALCILPIAERTGVVEDSCDIIELNHVYSDSGDHFLSQWIFWTKGERRAFDVKAWRLAKGQTISREGNRWMLLWHDGELTRRVEAKAYRETWRQSDVELNERDVLPKDMRRELFMPRKETPLRDAPHELDLMP